ncbi:MAG: LysR family transcriptional regulator [Clostridiaceae bacterium]|nr:LysR family transcriptional regulator [Clostridiaceae bacterium]
MDEKDIELLLVLDRERNITHAAEKLFISQSSLTRRIQALEKELNTLLVISSNRGTTFTYQGERLLTHCKALNMQFQNMRNEIQTNTKVISGTLRIGVSHMFATQVLPELLKNYLTDHPQIELSIAVDRSKNILNYFEEGDYSIAIIRGNHSTNHQTTLLTSDPVCLAYHKKVGFDLLRNIPYLEYRTRSSLQYQISHWLAENDLIDLNTVISTSRMDILLAFVKAGIGWSIIPQMGLMHFPGYVQPLNWKDGKEPFCRNTSLLYRKEQFQIPVISSFIEFALKYCSEIQYPELSI